MPRGDHAKGGRGNTGHGGRQGKGGAHTGKGGSHEKGGICGLIVFGTLGGLLAAGWGAVEGVRALL